MGKTLHKNETRRAVLLIIAAVFAGFLLVSCGGGGYGGGGGAMYGGGMSLPPAMFSLISPAPGATVSTTTPTLTWGASLYATGYYVYLSSDGGKSYMLIKTTTNTSFTTAALTAAATYDWKVTAFNNSGMMTAGPRTFRTP